MIHFHPFIRVHQRCLRYQIFAFLDFTSPLMPVGWGTVVYISGIARSASMWVGCLYRARKFLPPDATLYLYKTTIHPLMEYCCHFWAGASACHLSLWDRVQERIVNVAVDLKSTLRPLFHRRSVASLYLFYRYFHGESATSVFDLVPLFRLFERKTRLSACSYLYACALLRCITVLNEVGFRKLQ